MQQYKSVILAALFLSLFMSSWLNAQETGGTYTIDENVGIIDLRENDSRGIPVHENSTKTVSAIVTASDDFGSNGPAYIQDNQAGIAVYGSDFVSQLTTGDSITITAKVIFFRGLTELTYVDGESNLIIHKNSSLPEPDIVTIPEILNQNWDGVELLEGKLLQIDNVSFVESGTFSGNANYQITDGTNNLNVRIDGDTDIGGNPIPTTEFSLVGCLGQFDSSEPYSTGYQLFPRNEGDIIVTTVVSDFSADITFGNVPLTVNFTDLSLNNPTSWSWNFGDGNTSTAQNPQHTYTAVGDYTVSLTVSDETNTNTKIKPSYISVVEGVLTTTSENFIFYYSKPELCTENLIQAMETKFNNLDYTIWGITRDIYLLDRSQKIKVFLYDTDEAFVSAPADIRDWDVGYYRRDENEIHIKVPSTERQLNYFPNFEKAVISVLARYVMAKKRTDGNEPSKGLSFGFGLYESGYSPDLNLIRNYLNANSNTFPNSSTFSTWDQLDEELNVELAYTYVFASIFRRGYFMGTVYDGLYENDKDVWYQIIRIFFLLDLEDGGMRKFIEEDDFIIYSNSQEEANLVLEGLRWYADLCEKTFNARINHPLLVTIYGSYETYTYTRDGNIDVVVGGGEALSHSVLRATSGAANLDTELNRILAKHNDTMQHEFTHNVVGFLAETSRPAWLNEGVAMNIPERRIYGYIGLGVYWFEQSHNYWNDQNMYIPDLINAFSEGNNPGFGYHMSYSAFTFIQNNVSKETLIEFIKRSDDFSIIGYSGIDEFQRHLYEFLYHQYVPNFLFNPNWNLETVFTPGTNYLFTWDGHYINDLILEYSTDGMNSWNHIAEVTLSSGSYSWNIPDAENCILRFSDKRFPKINFTYQILGVKPTFGKILYMNFENGTENSIPNCDNGRLKGNVSFESRDGQNGSYAKFDGMWDLINVLNYQNLSFSDDWTIQGDFIIENTTGVMNRKPVLLEKMATLQSNKNYSVTFNKNGLKHLFFEYDLVNNTTVSLEVDANVSEGNWYTFYFARSVENNIVEARVYDQNRNLLGSKIRQINGEGKVLTGAGDLYLGGGNPSAYEECLQGGLDNIIIADTYYDELMSNSVNNPPVVYNIPDQTINEGGNFAAINLDNFVNDPDNETSEITWSYSGNSELSVEIDGNRVATITIQNAEWNGSETITFTATDPEGSSGSDDVVFTVTRVNDAPVVSDIPGQTISEGNSFTIIQLDSFVDDVDNADDEITWSYSGNSDLSVTINGSRIATIATPNTNWNGSETITFTATDPDGASANDRATFSVTSVNDGPVVTDIPNQTINEGSSFATINLDDYVSDPDNTDEEISWTATGNSELTVNINSNRVAAIAVPNENWNGSETITFTATDPNSVSDNNQATFTVTPVNDPPVVSNIPDQTINEGGSFTTINLNNFVTDPDNEDSEISWSFSGNDELSVTIDGNRVATVSIPDENWFGSEVITFTATDPENTSGSNDAVFIVNPVNDPPVISGAPEFVEFVSDTSFTIDIWELVSDIETVNESLQYEFSVDPDSILFSYNDGTGILTLSAEIKFGGAGELSWSVSDSEALAVDTIHITVEKAITIGVDDEMIIPNEYVLHQNYPNPFNPSTMIKYGIPEQSNVRIEVFNMLGQSVSLLINSEKSAGYYETTWDASNLPSGIYLISIRAKGLDSKMNFIQVNKALLLK